MKSTLLLSIHPRFAEGILAGVKRVELRRRLPRVETQDAVVMYATVPTKAIVGSFTVESVARLPLRALWRRVRDNAGVTRAEYLDYFDGVAEGVGIFVGNVEEFNRPVPLAEVRSLWPGFRPPQGFCYMEKGVLELLRSLSAAPARRLAA